MDNQANKILSSAIAKHGNQLLTSDAFCKVYLTGYLADYPEERELLIDIKQQDLPKAFLDFKEGKITEAELHQFIDHSTSSARRPAQETAWGVDAWASAADLPETVRLDILKQCFGYSNPVLGFSISTPKPTTKAQNAKTDWTSVFYKTAAVASLAGFIWMMLPAQETNPPSPLKTTAPETKQPAQVSISSTFELASEPSLVYDTRTSAAEMIDQTLADLQKAKAENSPKPMVIVKTPLRKEKTKQLRAEIDAYLQNRQPVKR